MVTIPISTSPLSILIASSNELVSYKAFTSPSLQNNMSTLFCTNALILDLCLSTQKASDKVKETLVLCFFANSAAVIKAS